MCSLPPELSLDISPTFVPKTISDFLGEISAIRSVSERLLRLDEFLQRLEEEMRKIDAFKRELPLCMLLLNEAIVTLKEEAIRCRKRNAEPVFEEFIPLKNNRKEDEKSEAKKEKNNADKMNWMSSVQLWSTDHHKTTDSGPKQIQNSASQIIEGAVEESTLVADDPFKSCRAGMGAFMPFKGCSIFPAVEKKKEDKEELAAAGLSFLTPKATNLKEELSFGTSGGISVSNPSPSGPSNLPTGAQLPQQQTVRKQRRCWSPELHRRFVNALNQLGGSQVATPKQIRELMQVDGLTNDEVKSHLQKYRLHTRRIPAASNTAANKSPMSGDFWINQDNDGESSKKSNSSSGSPEGPLQLDRNIGGTSNTFGDSLEEDEEYEKSDSYGWKNPILKSGKVHL